ncbi:hypothetical protein EHI8A_008870 [Entamoeba histolytica HM-1:IMSS-B]|uniref:BRCT domain-containing protein n=6 Tax=Entamoeba histolytica TaxID=5759 RepID=C4LXK5_ENTH1|nr:hypothetical protein EHI_073400 [Entamoeba histolytica HM-1:IMSS]EMD44711.1 Hypothetical protein EHI5A_009250 [Entamoeba histolytica KU27]EMH74160.1 hypothetical protein EHI8A_008870 [Entamoeba histolytica HM-1:IMSS-B]EMS12491.1 hypothetical protein KM1_006860 [Entamoeba histolytica HM-3:IMSS]ENY63927.1 hypothetical protein EHI7A_011700 [Entamoeba histolytica HM-1:IMSS-A]GAT93487.1 hypothetical protein CL6EHI_073400 [Entamoeba histolytica]|eukprot:XP_656684.1 hypothetical protein EHI_073400 [Entamoeba histolytica HM-1:IMSS]
MPPKKKHVVKVQVTKPQLTENDVSIKKDEQVHHTYNTRTNRKHTKKLHVVMDKNDELIAYDEDSFQEDITNQKESHYQIKKNLHDISSSHQIVKKFDEGEIKRKHIPVDTSVEQQPIKGIMICCYGTTIDIPKEIENKEFNSLTSYVVYSSGKINKDVVEKCGINNIPIVSEQWLIDTIKSTTIKDPYAYLVPIDKLDIDEEIKRVEISNKDSRKKRIIDLLH